MSKTKGLICYKRDGYIKEKYICENCRHMANYSVARKIYEARIFEFIPILRVNLKYGFMCENCGFLYKISKIDYYKMKEKMNI